MESILTSLRTSAITAPNRMAEGSMSADQEVDACKKFDVMPHRHADILVAGDRFETGSALSAGGFRRGPSSEDGDVRNGSCCAWQS